MGLSRVLFVTLLVVAGWWLWKNLLSRPKKHPADPPQALPMVRCQHCRVHLPRTEAIRHNGSWYCNEQHAHAGPPSS